MSRSLTKKFCLGKDATIEGSFQVKKKPRSLHLILFLGFSPPICRIKANYIGFLLKTVLFG